MSHSGIEILEGAFLVSDAHYSSIRPELLDFIKDIDSKKLQPTQLIFFGDIFDTLFGGVSSTLAVNKDIVSLLNKISKEIELIYLEGNHDFNLKAIFPAAKVFSISQQPVLCRCNDKDVLIAHGDFGGDMGYKIYTSIVRDRFVLGFLNNLNNILRNLILKRLDKYLAKKDDCKELLNFKEYISLRLKSKFKCDYFIECHFHQNKSFNLDDYHYINLAAFACNQRYFIVKSFKEKELLKENIFSRETQYG